VFNRRTLGLSLLQGLAVLLVTLAVYLYAMNQGFTEGGVRALTFTTLILSNLLLILSNRSWSHSILSTLKTPNKALTWVVVGAVVFLALILCVPFLRGLFGFDTLNLVDLVIAIVAALVSIIWFEIVKVFNKVIK